MEKEHHSEFNSYEITEQGAIQSTAVPCSGGEDSEVAPEVSAQQQALINEQEQLDRQLEAEFNNVQNAQTALQTVRQSTRTRQRTWKALESANSTIPDIAEPKTYSEGVGDTVYGKQWEAAIHDELHSLNANSTWRLENLPHGRKAVTSKWVFKVKKHADGSLDCLKARVVARGFTQQYGVDYTQTYAPMVRMSSIRLLLALAALEDLAIYQIDVNLAY